MTKFKTKKRNMSLDEFRAKEHYENYVKSAFASACIAAKKKGWTWTFEGDEIIVNTGKHSLVCSDRLDFFKLVQEES